MAPQLKETFHDESKISIANHRKKSKDFVRQVDSFILLRLKPCQCDKAEAHSLGNHIRDVWPWFQKAIKGESLTE